MNAHPTTCLCCLSPDHPGFSPRICPNPERERKKKNHIRHLKNECSLLICFSLFYHLCGQQVCAGWTLSTTYHFFICEKWLWLLKPLSAPKVKVFWKKLLGFVSRLLVAPLWLFLNGRLHRCGAGVRAHNLPVPGLRVSLCPLVKIRFIKLGSCIKTKHRFFLFLFVQDQYFSQPNPGHWLVKPIRLSVVLHPKPGATCSTRAHTMINTE